MAPRSRRAPALLLLMAVMTFGVTSPAAADVSCSGAIGAQTIDDNLRVPQGGSCTLHGTTIKGNVLVGTSATLNASGVAVDGNVQDDGGGAGDIVIADSHVGGSIQLEQGAGAIIERTVVQGDVQLESNGGALRANANTIGGNLQANQNTAGLEITGNVIDGNLQCQSNTPAPVGGGNTVHGSAEGQCSDLAGGTDRTVTPAPSGRETGRLAGRNRFETAVAITRVAFPTGAPVVYLARADVFADALAASSLDDGPILLVPACGDVPAVVLQEIRRLDPSRVVALGGTGAVCDAVLHAAASA